MPTAAPTPVVIVGPGRLGRTVAGWLSEAGVSHHLVGRGETVPPAPITWLTVPDRAIAEAASSVPRGGVVLHASGATGLAPLRPHAPAGSLHPLMTFPGPELGVPDRSNLPAWPREPWRRPWAFESSTCLVTGVSTTQPR